jgi:hypothetical protein
LGTQLGVVIGVVGAVLEALAPIITVVLEALEPLIQALEPLFELLGVIAGLIGTVLEPIITALGAVLLWLVENVIVPYVIPIIEALIDLLVLALGTAIEWVVQQFQSAGENLSIIFEFIKEKGEEHTQALIGAWNLLQAAFRTAWNIINNNVFTPFKNGIAIVKNAVLGHLNTMKTGWDTFVGFIVGIPRRISGALSNMFSPLASGFRSAINSVISGWNNLSFSIPSVDIPGVGTVGGGTINTPNIPYLQTGGFTQAEGLAMLHPDEMVLPLTNSNGINALADAFRAAGLQGSSDQPIQVVVQIGNETITHMVDTRVNQNNKTLARRARAATGRN